MVFSLTVPIFFLALADPILEAAAQQQDKEHVVEYFAAARARELNKLNKARQADLASYTAAKTELYSKLKTASDNYWQEHATRASTEDALHNLEKQRAKEVEALTSQNEKEKASLSEAQSKVLDLTEKLKSDDEKLKSDEEKLTSDERALEASHKDNSGLKTEVGRLQKEVTASAASKAEEHAKDAADIKRLEGLNAQLRTEAEKDSAAAASNLDAARREGSRANAEATRARGALARDKELLQQVKTDAEKKIADLESQWKKEEAAAEEGWKAQQKDLEAKWEKEREETATHVLKEEAALKELQGDRVELQKVAEAAVAKVDALEAKVSDIDLVRKSESAQATADAEALRAEVAELRANLTQRDSENRKLSAALESAEAEVSLHHSGIKQPHPPKAAPLVSDKEPVPVPVEAKEAAPAEAKEPAPADAKEAAPSRASPTELTYKAEAPKPHSSHHHWHHKKGHGSKIHMKFLHT